MNDSIYKQMTIGMLYAALLALFAALATYLVSGIFGNPTKILLIIGGLLLVGYLVMSPETVLSAFRSRGAKYGGNTLAMVALFVVIIGAGNWFTNTHSPNFDITANKIHTLTPQTLQILGQLNQDVKVTGFFQTGQFDEQQAKDLLQQYASHSSRIQYRLVDPDKDPISARQYGIVSYGTTVFEAGGHRKDVPTVDEQGYTSALLAVTSTEQRKIYFVTGNGQPDPNQSRQNGFHDALIALQNDNYVVGTLDATAGAVPDDAAAVVLTSGTQPLQESQKKAFADYLGKGGKMLVASAGFADTDLNDVVKPYGLQFLQGITIDPVSFLQQGGPQMPAVSRYLAPDNEIVKNLSFSVFPVADGIQVSQPAPQGMTVTTIAQTAEQGWLQNHKDQAQFREGDTRGPITLVATAEGTLPQGASPSSASAGASAAPTPIGGLANPTVVATPPPASGGASASAAASGSPQASAGPTQTATPIPQVSGADVNLKGGSRIVAVADTEWMSDQFLNQVPGNHDLFLNSINHLVGNQALISIAAKNTAPGQVSLLGSDANLIFFTTVVFVPLIVLLIGGVVWWQRR